MGNQKLCSKCNASLGNGARFCTVCGTEVQSAPEKDIDTFHCVKCGAKLSSESSFCSQCGEPLSGAGTETAEAGNNVAQKKNEKRLPRFRWKYVCTAIAVLLVVVISVSIIGNIGGSKLANNMIYVKDGELQYAYLSKMKTFELTDRLNNQSYDWASSDYMFLYRFLLMSEDGRYVFYPDKVEYPSATYYWRDLRANHEKVDAVKIDSNIYLYSNPVLTKDGNRLFYIKGEDNRLYIYNRKSGEKTKLDENVSSFYVNETGDYLIYDTYSDGEYTIYFIFGNEAGKVYYFKDVKDMSGDMYLDGKAIVSDIYIPSLYIYEDTDKLLYFTDYDKENMAGTLCMFVDGKQTRIADDVSIYVPTYKNNIAYLTDYSLNKKEGDLMIYNGRKSVPVDSGVSTLLWNKNMI